MSQNESPLPLPKTVLITRPIADAEPLAAEITRRGGTALLNPLLNIQYLDVAVTTALQGIEGLLFTSANGVRAFARLSDRRTLPVWSVGPATAAEAQKQGFTIIHQAKGDVTSLANLLAREWKQGLLLHITGQHRAGNLSHSLARTGIEVRSLCLYHARRQQRLLPQVQRMLQRGEGLSILLYSPRTVEIFNAAVQKEGLNRFLCYSAAVCLSSAVAETLEKSHWGRVTVPDRPDQDALLKLLEQAWWTG